MTALAPTNPHPVSSWPSGSDSTLCPAAQLSGACALLAVLIQTQTSSQSGARVDIEWKAQRLDELKQQLADSIQQAKDAANDSGFLGFLGDVFGSDIAQIAGAIATVAAVVATGGAAAPLIAIALSEALQIAAKVGPELGLPPELCLALCVASVAVGFCGGGGTQAIGNLANTARDVEFVAKVTQGAATIEGAVLHYAAGQYHADSLRHQADSVGFNAESDTTSLDMDDALDLLARALRTGQREIGTVSEISRNNSDAATSICDRI